MSIRLTLGVLLAAGLPRIAALPSTKRELLPASATIRCPSGGSAGGNFTLSPWVDGAFAISFDTSGVRLDAVMLLRGQRRWAGDATGRTGGWPPDVPRQPGDRPPGLTGATVDTFAVVYDRANDVAWIGGQRVPMEGANVVLLDRADGVGGPPVVLERRRVASRVPTTDSTCAMADPHRGEDLKALLMADSTIRAFATP